jgi:hypothetical protein
MLPSLSIKYSLDSVAFKRDVDKPTSEARCSDGLIRIDRLNAPEVISFFSQKRPDNQDGTD